VTTPAQQLKVHQALGALLAEAQTV
jgi:hypothetical protein